MNPKISLIIPVYNVERYLDKCMNSVLAQTYDNFEVILVDDGSTDRSGDLCDEYAKKDDRINVYHKVNGGLSDARNFGVEHSNGSMVSFIDSDDYITEDYLEYLWDLMKRHDSDVSCAEFLSVYDGESPVMEKHQIEEITLNAGQAIERICYNSVSACARLYKKEIVVKHKFPIGRLYEDIATVYKYMDECDTVAFSNKEIYIRIQRKGSITHSGINEKQMDVFRSLDELYYFVQSNYHECVTSADYRYISDTIYFLNLVFSSCNLADEKKYYKLARNKAKNHLWPVFKRDATSVRFKLAILCIYLGFYPSKVLFELRNIQKGAQNR